MPATSLTIETIDSSKIFKADYQRPTDAFRVKRIASSWKDEIANLPKVSYRDGKYWVFDGAHTLSAIKTRNGNKDLPVQCRVYRGLTYKEEAELFILQNGISRAVDTNSKLKAKIEIGDIEVIEFKKAVESVGITMDFSKGQGINKIICCGTAYKLFTARETSRIFLKMLELVKFAWGGIPSSFQKEILIGMDLFVATYMGEFKENVLTDALSNVTPKVLIVEAKTISAKQTNIKYALEIVRIYNSYRGKRAALLEEGKLYK